jgi:superfamily II DNA or RNA helicase
MFLFEKAADRLGIVFKDEQLSVLRAVVEDKKSVYIVQPTGYGKTTIFKALALVEFFRNGESWNNCQQVSVVMYL